MGDHLMPCQQARSPGNVFSPAWYAVIWAAFSLPMAWSAWHLQLQGAMMPMGYKTDLPLPAKLLAGLSESPSHPGDDYPTHHCSLSPSPPSCHANKSRSAKGHGFLPRICSLHPTACCHCCHCSLCLCCWDIETREWIFCF